MDIGAWLRDLELLQYEQSFRDNHIDGEILVDLTESDLERLGVVSLGHRKKLLKAIAGLATPPEDPCASPTAQVPTGPTPAETRPGAERRQLTVLFCDLVGSTELSARLDPEDMREVITAYQGCCAQVIDRFEGHVAKYMGDGVLAYFGYPRTHEDEAERAVRAGLALTEAVSRLRGGGDSLAARVGIATGQVVVGDLIGEGAAQEEAVVGETPNLAARLQGLAKSGDVVIGQGTQRLLAGLFELDDLGRHELKGFGVPVRAWRVTAESRAESRFEALHGTKLTPLVGREEELALLLSRWRRAREGDGQVILLIGEPGIGKSRLVQALRAQLEGTAHTQVSHFCSAYHTNSVLHPVIGLLERAAGFGSDEPAEVKLTRLETLLAQGTDDLTDAMPLIADLLGIPVNESYPCPVYTPRRKAQRTLEVLVEQVEGLAARQPVLAIYEDVHWIDPTTLELLELLIARVRQLPVLVVITFRPEFDPPWSGHAHVTQLSIARLGRREGAQVVARITGGKVLPEEILAQIIERTDGVPLFVEELTKTVLESGLLRDAGDRFEPVGPLPSSMIPTTLQDSLMARLDRLAPVKEVAQIGAVIGREFPHELLASVLPLSGDQLGEALDELIRSELVFCRGTPPAATYTFKHALVQDTAYQSLLRSRRRQLHGQIATMLEEHFPETADQQPEVLARHLNEAGLLEPAAEAWARAGSAALGRSAMREATQSLSQAVDLLRRLPPSDEISRRELELLGSLGGALTNTRGAASPQVQQVQERAERLAKDLGDREGYFRARWSRWRVHNVRAEFDQAITIGETLLGEAVEEVDGSHELQAHHALWSSLVFKGDFEVTVGHVERGLAIYDVTRHGQLALLFGSHDARECGLTWGSTALFLMGHPERALARNREGIDHALALGQPPIVGHAHNWGSILLQLAGELDELRRRTDTLARLADEHGLAIYYPEARMLAAWLAVNQERHRDAIQDMRDFLDRRAAMGTVYLHTYFLMLLADACLHLDHADEAMARLDEALKRATATGEHFCTAELHRLRARARLAIDADARVVAERDLRTALDEARGRSSRIFELRAACDLARLWAERGRRAEAQELLAPIYGWFTEGFHTADLKEAKALLEELR